MTDRREPRRIRVHAPSCLPKPKRSEILTWPDGLTACEKKWLRRVWQYDKNSETIEVRGDPFPLPMTTGDRKGDAIRMWWYKFLVKYDSKVNVWTYCPAEERTYVGYVRSSYRRMHDSLESEGSVTLANWERILRLHLLISFLGYDGTFRYTIHKEKYKEYLTKIGFEVSRILEKTWRKKSREMRAKHSFEETGSDDADSNPSEKEDDDVTVAVTNCAKDEPNNVWKEEEEIPMLVSVPTMEPTPVLVSDSIPDVVSKSIGADEGGEVSAECCTFPEKVGNTVNAEVECTEGDKYHIADDVNEVAGKGQHVRAILNQLQALIESCKSS